MIHNSFISMHLFDTRTLKLITGRFFSLFLFSLLSCISAMSSLIIVNHFSLYVLGFDPLIQRYEKLCYLSALNFLECCCGRRCGCNALTESCCLCIRTCSGCITVQLMSGSLTMTRCACLYNTISCTLYNFMNCNLLPIVCACYENKHFHFGQIFFPHFHIIFCYSILICLNEPNEWNSNAFSSDRTWIFFFNEKNVQFGKIWTADKLNDEIVFDCQFWFFFVQKTNANTFQIFIEHFFLSRNRRAAKCKLLSWQI